MTCNRNRNRNQHFESAVIMIIIVIRNKCGASITYIGLFLIKYKTIIINTN